MIEAEHMVKVLAIEGFLQTCYRRKEKHFSKAVLKPVGF
jgi:hypothetical protein